MARMKLWMMGVVACLTLAAGIPSAKAQVVVVRRGYNHGHHHYNHRHVYYRHGHRYYRYY